MTEPIFSTGAFATLYVKYRNAKTEPTMMSRVRIKHPLRTARPLPLSLTYGGAAPSFASPADVLSGDSSASKATFPSAGAAGVSAFSGLSAGGKSLSSGIYFVVNVAASKTDHIWTMNPANNRGNKIGMPAATP